MRIEGRRPTEKRFAVCVRAAARLVMLPVLLVLPLALPAPTLAATYTWTGGGGADANWSNAANWGGSGPSNDESSVSLMFPALAGHYDSHNDLTGLHVTFLSITTQLSDGTYTFTGNPLSLEGPSTLASPGTGNPNLVWQIPLTVGANVTVAASGRQTQLQADIDLGTRTLTFNAGGDIVLAGVVSGSGNIIKNNTAALTIRGANTYTGTTTSNSGALYISNSAALGSGDSGTTIAGGFLGFTADSAFTLSEPLLFTGGGIVAYGTPTIGGPLTVNATIDAKAFEAASLLTITSAIGGSGGLTTSGAGTVVLSGAEAYAGATSVGAGTLQLDGSLASTGAVTVKSGATLRGNGSTAGAISVEASGTLAPGDSPGALACRGLTMVAGATLAVEVDGPTAVSGYDQVAVSGPVSLGGATLAVTLGGFAPADGQSFTIVAQQQGQSVAGTFAGLPEGATFELNGTTFGITYGGGSGHDVVLIASPGSNTPTPMSETPGPSPTPTPTAVGGCTGDCDGNGAVGINELISGVNIALDNASVDSCPAFDVDGDGKVAIQELIAAVNNALGGCH